ncbi:MAG: hypothetical protein ACLQGP_37455 [Isosphaeraceae bacterium]
MGATYWEAITAYEEVPEAALRKAQVRFFRDAGYDIPKYLARRVRDMIEAVRSCEEDDPYGLLGFYRDALDQYRQIAARGVPEESASQIEMLRLIEQISGDSIGNILDMTGFSQDQVPGSVQRLSPERMENVFGTATPSLSEVRDGMAELEVTIHRGTAVGFPVYEDGHPVSWLFAGYSAD